MRINPHSLCPKSTSEEPSGADTAPFSETSIFMIFPVENPRRNISDIGILRKSLLFSDTLWFDAIIPPNGMEKNDAK
jgi:hypothetical protein